MNRHFTTYQTSRFFGLLQWRLRVVRRRGRAFGRTCGRSHARDRERFWPWPWSWLRRTAGTVRSHNRRLCNMPIAPLRYRFANILHGMKRLSKDEVHLSTSVQRFVNDSDSSSLLRTLWVSTYPHSEMNCGTNPVLQTLFSGMVHQNIPIFDQILRALRHITRPIRVIKAT